jgi:hypothetical protein
MSDKPKSPRKKAAPAEAKPPGRPSSFTQEVADEIISRLSKGEPLEKICRDDHLPPVRTVNHWREANAAFMADIARAREEGYDALAAQCLDIADETAFDTIIGENGDRANTEWISRSKLRVETRLKLLAKWDPKRYGDKTTTELTGPNGGPVEFTGITRRIVKANE